VYPAQRVRADRHAPLGEAAQLDSSFHYPSGRNANQLALEHVGMVAPGPEVPPLPDPQGSAPLEQRARAILRPDVLAGHRAAVVAPGGCFCISSVFPPSREHAEKA
jgi:hypothetical protein